MRIDFSFNREKSLHMYNLFFLKLSENILSYKKPKKKQNNNNTKNTQKGHRKKASNVNFLFFIIFNGL